jgi:hypothetical protein
VEAKNACYVADLALDKYIAKDASVTGVAKETTNSRGEKWHEGDHDAEMIRDDSAGNIGTCIK